VRFATATQELVFIFQNRSTFTATSPNQVSCFGWKGNLQRAAALWFPCV